MFTNLSTFLQLKANTALYLKMGWRFTFFYMFILGKIYFNLKRSERKNVIRAVENVFMDRKPMKEIRSIARKVFEGIFFHYYEKIFNAYANPETLRFFLKSYAQADGLEAITDGLSKGKGVLVVTGHFGAVELMPAFLGLHGFPVTIVAKFKSEQLRASSGRQAANFNTEIIDAEATPNIPKAIFQALRKNRVVITQCDEVDEWRPSAGEFLSFLGKTICLDRTMNILSKRTGAAVIFALLCRTAEHRYNFIAEPAGALAKRLRWSDAAPVAALSLKFLEQHIYQYPENWYLWKKYPQMPILQDPDPVSGQTALASMMKPIYGKTS